MKVFILGLAFAMGMAFLQSTTTPPPATLCLLTPSFGSGGMPVERSCMKSGQRIAPIPPAF